ncbi:ankyrin repeat-containing domain protein [Mycena epipterygia]|nr:ankyrin repeat-containing domain protein [Mycena epipterygia]
MAESILFASSVTGLIALANQITTITYGYLCDVRDVRRRRGQYLTELSAFTDALLLAEEAVLGAESANMLSPRPTDLSADALGDCHNQLVLLRQDLEGVWPLGEKQLKKHINMLHRFRGIFADYVSVSTLAVTEGSDSQLDSLTRERDRSQLLEWLQPPSPPLHGSPTELACSGTGNWFLESDVYVRWRASAPSLLWCHGKPGVGKSILSYIILQDLLVTDSVSAVVLHYFCDFAAGKQQTATLILQSLVRQMLAQGNDGHISMLKRCRESLSTPPSLKDLFQAFIEMCKLQRTGPYIVLDALDELEGRKVLLPLLGELVQAGCHIFATSPHIPDIADALAASEQFELEANRADLKLFIESELQASDFAHASGTSSIVDAIVDQAGGTFLLARLLTNHLLALATIEEIRGCLTTLPSNLTSACQSSLDRILAQPPAHVALALRVIAWITHAERRLKMAEMLHAFAVEDDMDEIDEQKLVSARMVLQVCVGLVLVNDDTSVNLVHSTAHEFFQEMPEHFANAHNDMASTCLRYLCMRTFGTGPCENPLEMDARLQNMPFLAYAAHHWGRHARRVEQPLIPLIRKLLDNENWRESSFQALHYRKHIKPLLAGASFAALPTGQVPLHVVAYWDLGETAKPTRRVGLRFIGPASREAPSSASFSSSVAQQLIYGTPTTGHHYRGAEHLARDIYCWTALQWAVSCGQRSAIEVLLNHHARFLARETTRPPVLIATLTVEEARKYHGACSIVPAEIAAEMGDADLLDLVLQGINPAGARSLDFNQAWKRGYKFDSSMTNVLRATSKYERFHGHDGFLDSEGTLISPNDGRPVRDWRSRLLHAAIRDNKLNMVRLLLELGAEANYTVGGRTTLHTAAFREDARFVEILPGAGADTTLLDNYGYTALHHAIMNGFEETTAALVNGGADVNARTDHRAIIDSRITTKDYRAPVDGTTPLMLACGLRFRFNDETDPALPARIAQLLVAAGADTTATNELGNAAIHYAIEACDFGLVKLLLKNGVKIPALPDSAGHSFIHTAVKACDMGLVKLLLENGAKIPPPDLSGYCVIHAFAEGKSNGSTDDLASLLNLLLDQLPAGAESMEWTQPEQVWSVSDTGVRSSSNIQTIKCPLSLAMKSGNWDVVTALLKRGAHLRTKKPLELFLREAIRKFHPDAVRFLLDHGAKLGSAGGDIIDLMRNRNLAHESDTFALILSDLLQRGGNINSVTLDKYFLGGDMYLSPPLLLAAKSVNIPLEIVQALLAAGADLYQTNNEGLDAFVLAALHENVATLCCLLETTTKVSHSSGHWTQPLYSTNLDPSNDSIAYICECLKQHNLLAQRTKTSNKPLLQLAVEAGSTRTVAHLIACGADANEADSYGWTALHKAIWNGNEALVDVLLSANVDVHAATSKWLDRDRRPTALYEGSSWTGQPLHLAAMMGDVRIMKELLERGADVHASTGSDKDFWPGHGPTALHIALDVGLFYGQKGDALDRGRLEIAVMLIKRGARMRGVVDRLMLGDVLLFEGFEDLWNQLRAGITDKAGKL